MQQATLSVPETLSFSILPRMDTRGRRIAYLRNGMGFSQVGFAELVSVLRRATGKTSLTRGSVGNWELDKGIDLDNLQLVADMVPVSIDWILRNSGVPPDEALLRAHGEELRRKHLPPEPVEAIGVEDRGSFPESVVLYGTVAASMLGRGAFLMSEEPIGTLPMMPGLMGEKGVYGLIVKGDSMYPMFSDGDPIYVSSVRQPHKNDVVVVQERDSANGQPQGFVKLYQRETSAKLFTRQFNPDSAVIFEKRGGIERHRVYTRKELTGV